MKKTKEIQVPVMGGGTQTCKVTITDEYQGQILGQSIRGDDRIVEESTDHIERADQDTLTFDFGTVRKERIESLEWHDDGFGSTVRRVRFAV
jgi:hypothetical protein